LHLSKLVILVTFLAAGSWSVLSQTSSVSNVDSVLLESELKHQGYIQFVGIPLLLDNFNLNHSQARGGRIDISPIPQILVSAKTTQYFKTAMQPNYDPKDWNKQGAFLPVASVPIYKINRNYSNEAELTYFILIRRKNQNAFFEKSKKNKTTTYPISLPRTLKTGLTIGWRQNHYLINNYANRFVAPSVSDSAQVYSFPDNSLNQTILHANILKIGFKTSRTKVGKFRYGVKTHRITRFFSFYVNYLSTINYELSDVFAVVDYIETVNGFQNQYKRFNLQEQTPFSKRGFNIGFTQSISINRLNLYYEIAFERQPNIRQNSQYSVGAGLGYVFVK